MSYTYDAWGYHTVAYHNGGAVTPAQYNPFRYRGYYYDSDLGMYYLNARYYDPYTARFISMDGVEYLGAGGDLNSYNLYSYCNNNPVNYIDYAGNLPWPLIVVIGVFVACTVMTTSGILEGLTEEDSSHDQIGKSNDGNTRVFYYDFVVKDKAVTNQRSVATSAGLTAGVCDINEEFGDFKINAGVIKANGSLGLLGGSVGIHAVYLEVGKNINLFGKDVYLSIEGDIGLGADLQLGPKTKIGASYMFGLSITLERL